LMERPNRPPPLVVVSELPPNVTSPVEDDLSALVLPKALRWSLEEFPKLALVAQHGNGVWKFVFPKRSPLVPCKDPKIPPVAGVEEDVKPVGLPGTSLSLVFAVVLPLT